MKTIVCSTFFLLLSGAASAQEKVWPGDEWTRAEPAELGLDAALLSEARDYAAGAGGSGLLVRHGSVAIEWGDPRARYDLKSSTKSIGSIALAVAIADGKLELDTPVRPCVQGFATPPAENLIKGNWVDMITVFHLATHTAGFKKPGGYEALYLRPGTKWAYSDGGPNWLADCITTLYRRDIEELLFERVFTKLGVTREDLRWRDNQYRTHELRGVKRREFGSGVHADVDAMARIGYLFLHGGEWNGERVLPAGFVEKASRPLRELVGLPVEQPDRYPAASGHYGLLWWNNADGALKGVPRDAFWSWGLYDSLIVVIPSLDLVVARAGPRGWDDDAGADFAKLAPLLQPIVAATGAPYPPSDITLEWAPPETVIRKAEGGDNWPLTWTADDALFTAYGDGWGFEPLVDEKLSLGFSWVTGGPTDFEGTNIRSSTGEQKGQGPAGKKASGMLMVDGTLYMLARNARNSQLAWSEDDGQTWEWADWRFRTGFGAPSLLNFGRNYAEARDGYVYVYSPESDSAYLSADSLSLARVPRERIRERDAYEFFDGDGWTSDVEKRGEVFRNPGRVYRSSVSYSPALKRYLLCQILPDEDTRFEGGFGIYDAPEPWGPWTTVFYTARWDMGPGETCHIPPKWMDPAGRSLHLVFSGEDSFSVRKATIRRR